MPTFASTIPWLLPPSEVICAVRHFLHPLAFCLCFGLLLLKVMQLRSLVSVGLGGTIPQVSETSEYLESCIQRGVPAHLETIELYTGGMI